jgi:hypothetical protein
MSASSKPTTEIGPNTTGPIKNTIEIVNATGPIRTQSVLVASTSANRVSANSSTNEKTQNGTVSIDEISEEELQRIRKALKVTTQSVSRAFGGNSRIGSRAKFVDEENFVVL